MKKLIKVIISVGMLVGAVWIASFVVDAARTVPSKPSVLTWLPGSAAQYVRINGLETRYLREGSGPNLLLLHTFSTEIGHFRKIIPELRKHYTVWALDLPGFGYSDFSADLVTPEGYADFVSAFIAHFEITDVTLVGESIGGTIPLVMSADEHPEIHKIAALDPIGAAPKPLARSSKAGSLFHRAVSTPIVGEFVLRMRSASASKAVLDGAVADTRSIPTDYFTDLMTIAQRPEFAKAQLTFIRNAKEWGEVTGRLADVRAETLLLWGSQGWATAAQRAAFTAKLPNASALTLQGCGHFIALDCPDAVLAALMKQ